MELIKIKYLGMADFGDEIIIRDPTGKFKILRGGKLYDLAEKPAVGKSAPPVSKLADEVLGKSGLVLAENLKGRFAEIIEAYSRDVRDKFETKSILVQQTNRGGVGLSPEEADLIVKLIVAGRGEKPAPEKIKEKRVPIRKETLPAKGIIREKSPGNVPAAKPKTMVLSPGVAEFVFSSADEAEILAEKNKLPKTTSGQKPVETNKVIKEIITESGVLLSPEARQKLEGILLIHLKDIRDGFETGETLGGAASPAGISLNPEEVEKIISLARKKLQQLGEKTKEEELQKIKVATAGEKTKSGEIREKTFGEIKNKMDARWQEITRKAAPPPMDVPEELIAPPVGMQVKAAGELPKISKAPPVMEKSLPSAPPAPVKKEIPAAPPRPTKTPFDLPEEEKPKPLQIFKPISPQQVRRPTPPRDNRPRLDDVKYVPKLVGPVEELREMTLVDWRRLNTNPVLAAEKVKEKLGLLERETFTKKIAGIKAWQESEVNKLYLEIGRESLQKGLPVDKVIASRLAEGKPAITVEEYRAIMELNRSLRY